MGNEVKVLAWPETIGAYWIIITISLVLSVFVPRLWRKGCTRTCRWFSRVSRRGPFFRCCCWSVRASLGRCFVKGAVLPAAVKVRAAVSKAATITWQHEPSTVLSDDSFELEVRLRGEGNEWRSVYTGGDTSHRVPELLPDSVFEARVRTKNQSGCSEFTEPVSFCTRQEPVRNGGKGPRLTDEQLIEKELLAPGLSELLGVPPETALYTWTQTEKEVELRLRLPPSCRGRELEVDFQPTSIRVVHRPTGTKLLDGPLLRNVKHEDATWDVEEAEGEEDLSGGGGEQEARILELTLQKAVQSETGEKKERWACVVVGHPLIDVNVAGEGRHSSVLGC